MASALEERVAASLHLRLPTVEIAPGELLDKITILHIKSERMTDEAKLRHVRHELEQLTGVRASVLPRSPELEALTAELKAVNQKLWEIEDDIRRCERDNDFGPRFIALARSVYRTNDERSAIKRRINNLLCSDLVEEKDYSRYPTGI